MRKTQRKNIFIVRPSSIMVKPSFLQHAISLTWLCVHKISWAAAASSVQHPGLCEACGSSPPQREDLNLGRGVLGCITGWPEVWVLNVYLKLPIATVEQVQTQTLSSFSWTQWWWWLCDVCCSPRCGGDHERANCNHNIQMMRCWKGNFGSPVPHGWGDLGGPGLEFWVCQNL